LLHYHRLPPKVSYHVVTHKIICPGLDKVTGWAVLNYQRVREQFLHVRNDEIKPKGYLKDKYEVRRKLVFTSLE